MRVNTSQLGYGASLCLVTVALLFTTYAVLNETQGEAVSCGSIAAASPPIQSLLIESNVAEGVQTAALEAGGSFELLVEGFYYYSESGQRLDGRALLVDGARAPMVRLSADTYCIAIRGGGLPVRLRLLDSYYGDNSGHLTVRVFGAGQ